MKIFGILLSCFCIAFQVAAQQPDEEKQQVGETVKAFYTAFDTNGFDRASEFATEDWYHIDPFGGCTRGRENLRKMLTEIHNTFLKGVTDTIQDMSIRFVTPDVAVATVTSLMSDWTSPDSAKHVNERHIRTFVVVKRAGRWLIMQDQNTTIVP
jgi:conserved hypothetical protein